MDVALAADRLGVAQPFGDALDRSRDVAFGGSLRIKIFKLLEGLSGQRRSGPGAKILGRDVQAADLPQVIVDVARADVADAVVVVQIFKQLLAGQLLALADEAGQPRVLQVDLVFDAALAPKLETDARAVNVRVAVVHRRQAERAVLARIFIVADADQRRFENLHTDGKLIVWRQ